MLNFIFKIYNRIVNWIDLARYLLEDLDVDGRIILKWFFKKQDESVDWIDLA
jgi:hypothetical protein